MRFSAEILTVKQNSSFDSTLEMKQKFKIVKLEEITTLKKT